MSVAALSVVELSELLFVKHISSASINHNNEYDVQFNEMVKEAEKIVKKQ